MNCEACGWGNAAGPWVDKALTALWMKCRRCGFSWTVDSSPHKDKRKNPVVVLLQLRLAERDA